MKKTTDALNFTCQAERNFYNVFPGLLTEVKQIIQKLMIALLLFCVLDFQSYGNAKIDTLINQNVQAAAVPPVEIR